MPKKNKRKLQLLLAKKQQLQELERGAVVQFDATAKLPDLTPAATSQSLSSPKQEPPQAASEAANTPSNRQGLTRLLTSLAVVAALFIGTVVLANQSDYLTTFSDWFYQALALSR